MSSEDNPAGSYLELLLWRSEGDSLDFKRDQYKLDGATDDERSELVKDILAMVNAWRSDEAFILVGIDERQSPGAARVVGVSEHVKDSNVQQLMNSRTNRPVHFTCEVVSFAGKEVGIIRVPRQERPAFLKKGFGKLEAGVVYVRRGSATVEADADEIARMGAHAATPPAPVLRVEFGDPTTLEARGDQLSLSSLLLTLPTSAEIESLKPRARSDPFSGFSSLTSTRNHRYEEEFAEYMRAVAFYKPVVLLARNLSAVVARDVRIDLSIPAELVEALDSEPAEPSRGFPSLPTLGGLSTLPHVPDVEVARRGDAVCVRFLARKVQAGASVASPVFFLGALRSGEHTARGQIFTDQTTPSHFELRVTMTCEARAISLKDLGVAMLAATKRRTEGDHT